MRSAVAHPWRQWRSALSVRRSRQTRFGGSAALAAVTRPLTLNDVGDSGLDWYPTLATIAIPEDEACEIAVACGIVVSLLNK
jgi:hypothetical protein